MALHPSATTLILLLPLLVWRLCSRYKRLVGRQRTSRYRPWVSMGIYTLLLSLIVWTVWGQWHAFVASPLTMSVFGLMAGQTLGYAMALFLWRRRVLAAKHERETVASTKFSE